MPEVTSYAAGTPCWVDLATSDAEAARLFYGGLFGWDFEVSGPEYGDYAMATLDGRDVAGIGPVQDESMPTAWTTYIAVDDSDAAAKRISELGGAVLMGPTEIPAQGTMILAADPTGAVFGTWQAGEHYGAALVNQPGSLTWNEVATRDLAAAQSFYTGLFGWDWEVVDTGEGGPSYQMFKVDGRAVGGALQMTEVWGDLPPHWMAYFVVADTDAAAASVERLGGAVAVPPTDSANGRFAVVRDPQGAVLSIIRPPA